MKRSRTTALIFGIFSLSIALSAQTTSPTSIVTINFNAAVLGTAEAQKELSALQKKLAPREQQLQKLNEDVEASRKILNDTGPKLTEAERNQKLQALSAKDKQLQRDADAFKDDSQGESQQVFQRVAQKVYAFLLEFSKQHAYAAVLERGTETAPIVWYSATNVDITDRVIKAYDLKSASTPASLPDKPKP